MQGGEFYNDVAPTALSPDTARTTGPQSSTGEAGEWCQVDGPKAVQGFPNFGRGFAIDVETVDLRQFQEAIRVGREGLFHVRQQAFGTIALDDVDFRVLGVDDEFVGQRVRLFGGGGDDPRDERFERLELGWFNGQMIQRADFVLHIETSEKL